ncbi:MAG: hypothetical protein LBF86_05415 [Helicobacteraceae bacterium]|nr:hypothetical protein [Helicobacteraceae bacterium]
MLEAQSLLAKTEGLFVCPEGAATLAAAWKLLENGCLLNAGSGLKYPDTIAINTPLLSKDA